MKLLLDTCVLLWTMADASRLSDTARMAIENIDNEVMISMVSLQEIAIKSALGKLSLSGIAIADIPVKFRRRGISLLDLSATDCERYVSLPVLENHRDPFDRFLVCQALTRDLTLVSAGSKMAGYRKDGLSVLW